MSIQFDVKPVASIAGDVIAIVCIGIVSLAGFFLMYAVFFALAEALS